MVVIARVKLEDGLYTYVVRYTPDVPGATRAAD